MENILDLNAKGYNYIICGANIYVHLESIELVGSWQKHLVAEFFTPYLRSSALPLSAYLIYAKRNKGH